MAEVRFEIVKQAAVLSEKSSCWKKELNVVSWNGAAPKYDIRDWSPDHTKMGKGITLSAKEADALREALEQEFADRE